MSSDLESSPEIHDIRKRVADFITEFIYPNEKALSRGGSHRLVRGDIEHRSNRCQTTANHDRTGPITTDLVSNKIAISRGFCCVVTNGDRPFYDMKSPCRQRRV